VLIETQHHKIHFPPLFFHNIIHDTHVTLISRIQRDSSSTVTFWWHVMGTGAPEHRDVVKIQSWSGCDQL
jgi:hypothetical protein